jgi:nucleotide-binding universal stress UspA family protein
MCDEYPPADPGLADIIQNKKKDIHRQGKDYLEQVASALVATGVQASVEISEGPVVAAILASAERLHIDLIAMSTCGESHCTRCRMGAVADRVLREAPVPVVLIRPIPQSSGLSLSSIHRVTLSV